MPSSFMGNLPPDSPTQNRRALTLHSVSVRSVGAIQGHQSRAIQGNRTQAIHRNRCLLDEDDRVARARLVLDRSPNAKRHDLGAQPRDVSPQGLLRQVSVMPRLYQEPGWADEVRRPAHKEDEQLEFALGERDHALAVGQGAPVMVDLQPLQLPLARIPELQAPSISAELAFERADVVFDNVCACPTG